MPSKYGLRDLPDRIRIADIEFLDFRLAAASGPPGTRSC